MPENNNGCLGTLAARFSLLLPGNPSEMIAIDQIEPPVEIGIDYPGGLIPGPPLTGGNQLSSHGRDHGIDT